MNRILSLLLLVCIGCSTPEKALVERNDIQGVWVASPEHTTLTHSQSNIKEGIQALDALGINQIFLCVWAGNQTAYPSKVLLENGSYPQIDSTSFYSKYNYSSQSNDPVRDLIEEAHKYGIAVHFWFEYGFMAAWGTQPDSTNNPILAKHPGWLGTDSFGRPANYNGSDYYFNSFDLEVQNFIIALIEEALDRYPEVDGIQGDDRLPASPANSGYNNATLQKYIKETGNKPPGEDFREPNWYQWRTDILNNFGQTLYKTVKAKNSNFMVSFSPNPYPWCYENLMQDWPAWLEQDYVDLLVVQCYRRSFSAYKSTLDEVITHAKRSPKLVPGMILGTGAGAIASPASLDSMIQYNFDVGLRGQSHFYVKWMLEDSLYHQSLKKAANLHD